MTPLRLTVAALLLSLPSAALGSEWLMMVKSENTDPSRAGEFERWYNEIDIPDVLAVPGYERARRGHGVATGGRPMSRSTRSRRPTWTRRSSRC